MVAKFPCRVGETGGNLLSGGQAVKTGGNMRQSTLHAGLESQSKCLPVSRSRNYSGFGKIASSAIRSASAFNPAISRSTSSRCAAAHGTITDLRMKFALTSMSYIVTHFP